MAMNHFNVVGTAPPRQFAQWHNALQELAAGTRLGIPVTLSTDPAHAAPTTRTRRCSPARSPSGRNRSGLAAARDPALVRAVRRHRPAGVPRGRAAGGAASAGRPRHRAALAPDGRHVRRGRGPGLRAGRAVRARAAGRVARPAQRGRHDQALPGRRPAEGRRGPALRARAGSRCTRVAGSLDHLRPFEAALAGRDLPDDARTTACRSAPSYEEVGFGFNRGVITGLLRERLGFDGIVCTDWGLLTERRLPGRAPAGPGLGRRGPQPVTSGP